MRPPSGALRARSTARPGCRPRSPPPRAPRRGGSGRGCPLPGDERERPATELRDLRVRAHGGDVVARDDRTHEDRGVEEEAGEPLAVELLVAHRAEVRVAAPRPERGHPRLLGRRRDRHGRAHATRRTAPMRSGGIPRVLHEPVPGAEDVEVLLRAAGVQPVLDRGVAVVAQVHEEHREAVPVEHAGRQEDDRVAPARAHPVDEDDRGRVGRRRGDPPCAEREAARIAAGERDVLEGGHRVRREVEGRGELGGDPLRVEPRGVVVREAAAAPRCDGHRLDVRVRPAGGEGGAREDHDEDDGEQDADEDAVAAHAHPPAPVHGATPPRKRAERWGAHGATAAAAGRARDDDAAGERSARVPNVAAGRRPGGPRLSRRRCPRRTRPAGRAAPGRRRAARRTRTGPTSPGRRRARAPWRSGRASRSPPRR